jgi:pimeloyl-ACP methyl ester carboxylesterase
MNIPLALDACHQFHNAIALTSDQEPPAISFVPLDGGNIYVRQEGPIGAAALVLIHGLAASTRWWDALIPLPTTTHHVIRIDLLGYGRSAKPAGGLYGMPEQRRPARWRRRLDSREQLPGTVWRQS